MMDKSPEPVENGTSKLASLIEEPREGIHESGFSQVKPGGPIVMSLI